jgi:hypothetical protein
LANEGSNRGAQKAKAPPRRAIRARTPLAALAGTAPLEVVAADAAGVADVALVVVAEVAAAVTDAVGVVVAVPVAVPDGAPEVSERAAE